MDRRTRASPCVRASAACPWLLRDCCICCLEGKFKCRNFIENLIAEHSGKNPMSGLKNEKLFTRPLPKQLMQL